MQSNDRKHWTTIGLIALVCLAIVGLFIHGHHQIGHTRHQALVAQTKMRHEKALDVKKHHQVYNDLFSGALHSKDPIVKTVAINHIDNTTIHKPFMEFFHTYYDWKNQQQYSQRPKELQSVATKNVLSNKALFKSNKTKNGGSIIDKQQLNSEFNDLDLYIIKHSGTNIDVLADAQFDSWHSNTDNQQTNETWYEMNFDTKSHKITSMKPLWNLQNVKSNNE